MSEALDRAGVAQTEPADALDLLGRLRIGEVVEIEGTAVVAAAVRGVPGADIEDDHVARLGGHGLAGYVGERRLADGLGKGVALGAAQEMRAGDYAQGAGVAVDGVEVEDVLAGDLVFVAGVGVPAGGAYVAVDVDADAQDVVAADLLGGNEKERVFHQRGSEGCGLVGHAGPQPLSAIVALGRVLGGDGSVEVADELVAVVRSEELAQDDIAEGFEEVELVCSEAGGHGLLTWSNARADGNRRRERATSGGSRLCWLI